MRESRLKDCDKKDVIIQDRIISHVTSTKFLGVIIDDKLKWNLHIIYMKNKIAKSNGILYKIRNFLDRKTLTHLYNSFVCLAGAVANVTDSDRCRCNPKVQSSIPAGGKDFP